MVDPAGRPTKTASLLPKAPTSRIRARFPTTSLFPSAVPRMPRPDKDSKLAASLKLSLSSFAFWTIAAASGCSLTRSRLPASRRISLPVMPGKISVVDIATTFGFPSVSVPVLSKTIVSTFSIVSSASAFLISTPACAPRPVPTMIAIGVAKPSAHGQAMIRTATAFTMAWASRGRTVGNQHPGDLFSAALRRACGKRWDDAAQVHDPGLGQLCALLSRARPSAAAVAIPGIRTGVFDVHVGLSVVCGTAIRLARPPIRTEGGRLCVRLSRNAGRHSSGRIDWKASEDFRRAKPGSRRFLLRDGGTRGAGLHVRSSAAAGGHRGGIQRNGRDPPGPDQPDYAESGAIRAGR